MRWLLFAGTEQCKGGWDDLRGSFDTPAEARKFIGSQCKRSFDAPEFLYDWWHVVDSTTGQKLYEWNLEDAVVIYRTRTPLRTKTGQVMVPSDVPTRIYH